MSKSQRVSDFSYLLDRSLNKRTFASRPLLKLIKKSLKRNLDTVKSLSETDVKKHVDSFMENDVVVDMHRVQVNRNANDDVVSITPWTTDIVSSNGQIYKFQNGLSFNSRNRRGINAIESFDIIPNHVFALIYVSGYDVPNGLHDAHAISAFVRNRVLYCFNPWGSKYILHNQRTGKVLADDHIWKYLVERYKCNAALVYTGKDFQEFNTKGACGGFASDFGTHMYNYVLQSSEDLRSHTGVSDVFFQITESRGVLHHSKDFNLFVQNLFQTFVGSFGNARFGCKLVNDLYYGIRQAKKITQKTTPNTDSARNRKTRTEIDLLNNLTKLSSTRTFKNAMRDSKWFNATVSDNAKTARSTVRRLLQEANPNLKRINGNTLNANITKYLISGNFQLP